MKKLCSSPPTTDIQVHKSSTSNINNKKEQQGLSQQNSPQEKHNREETPMNSAAIANEWIFKILRKSLNTYLHPPPPTEVDDHIVIMLCKLTDYKESKSTPNKYGLFDRQPLRNAILTFVDSSELTLDPWTLHQTDIGDINGK